MISPLFFLLFPLALIGYRKLFPYRQPDTYWQPNRQAFKKYGSWDKISGWLILLFFTIFMFIICGPLFNYRISNQLKDPTALFIVLPRRFEWIIIAWLPVFGLSAFFYMIASKLYLGDDFSGYIDYTNRKSQYNAYNAVIPLCGTFALFGITLFILLWNYNIYAYRDKIVVHWFLSTKAQVYPYNQIKSLSFTPEAANQGVIYKVVFRDGFDWDTSTGLKDPNIARDIHFISKQSGVKIDTLYAAQN